MNWIQSIGVAFLTGVLGLLCGGMVMNACVKWYRVSSFEGAAGYAVVGVALLSGLVAFILGLVLSRVAASGHPPGFLAGLGMAWGAVLAVAGFAALLAWLLADIPPTIGRSELMLEVEIKLPVGVQDSSVNASSESSLRLSSVVNHTERRSVTGELHVSDARFEDGRWIVPGEVHVFTTIGDRVLDIRLNGEAIGGYKVPLAARPGRKDEQWSEWGPRPPAGRPPWPDTKPSYRFRVQPIVEAPPEPFVSDGEREAKRVQEAFDALDPEAPLEAWLPYTRYGAPEERLSIAVDRIVARADYVNELARLMRAEDQQTTSDALRLIEHIEQPPQELVPAVAEAGRTLADAIRIVNETTMEEDPGYHRAADVSLRFSAWMVAVRTLRERSGGDFTPELGVILELSRVRDDSYVMRQHVLRVASYYMHQWAGLEPLPTDPKPR